MRAPRIGGAASGVGASTLAAALHGHERDGDGAVDVLVCRARGLDVVTSSPAAPVLAVLADAPLSAARLRRLRTRFAAVVVLPQVEHWAGADAPLTEAAALLTRTVDRQPAELRPYAAALLAATEALVQTGVLGAAAPGVVAAGRVAAPDPRTARPPAQVPPAHGPRGVPTVAAPALHAGIRTAEQVAPTRAARSGDTVRCGPGRAGPSDAGSAPVRVPRPSSAPRGVRAAVPAATGVVRVRQQPPCATGPTGATPVLLRAAAPAPQPVRRVTVAPPEPIGGRPVGLGPAPAGEIRVLRVVRSGSSPRPATPATTPATPATPAAAGEPPGRAVDHPDGSAPGRGALDQRAPDHDVLDDVALDHVALDDVALDELSLDPTPTPAAAAEPLTRLRTG